MKSHRSTYWLCLLLSAAVLVFLTGCSSTRQNTAAEPTAATETVSSTHTDEETSAAEMAETENETQMETAVTASEEVTETLSSETEPVHVHNWSGWKTVRKATTKTTGLMRRTCSGCGKTEEQTIAKLPAPTQTEPASTEPQAVPTAPSKPETPATESPSTQPVPCDHGWYEVYYPDDVHWVEYAMCACGEKFESSDDWMEHVKSYSTLDAVLYHGSWGSYYEYEYDCPPRFWYCDKCGEKTSTKPDSVVGVLIWH